MENRFNFKQVFEKIFEVIKKQKPFWVLYYLMFYSALASLIYAINKTQKKHLHETVELFGFRWMFLMTTLSIWSGFVGKQWDSWINSVSQAANLIDKLAPKPNEQSVLINMDITPGSNDEQSDKLLKKISILVCLAITRACTNVSTSIDKKYSNWDNSVKEFLTDKEWFYEKCSKDSDHMILLKTAEEILEQFNAFDLPNHLLKMKKFCQSIANDKWQKFISIVGYLTKFTLFIVFTLELLSIFSAETDKSYVFFCLSIVVLILFFLVFSFWCVVLDVFSDKENLNFNEILESMWDLFAKINTEIKLDLCGIPL